MNINQNSKSNIKKNDMNDINKNNMNNTNKIPNMDIISKININKMIKKIINNKN